MNIEGPLKESITRILGDLGGTLLSPTLKHAKKIREITSFESPVSPIKESQEKSTDTSYIFYSDCDAQLDVGYCVM